LRRRAGRGVGSRRRRIREGGSSWRRDRFPQVGRIGASTELMTCLAYGCFLHMFFMRRLQLQCHDEWERLGSPNPFLPNDAKTGLASYEIRYERSIRDSLAQASSPARSNPPRIRMVMGVRPGGFTLLWYCSLQFLRGFTGFRKPSNQSIKPTAPHRIRGEIVSNGSGLLAGGVPKPALQSEKPYARLQLLLLRLQRCCISHKLVTNSKMRSMKE